MRSFFSHQWQNRKYIIFNLTILFFFFCKNATAVNHGFVLNLQTLSVFHVILASKL
ncbi:unnamed protein product [Brassica rapa]|uniref:Uncharacterized protein n=1 Tax=Brassica campestris TaxID=3711 RepID=A0A8D9D507_BRACM|nr:unnamed protein product [Brassica rapa]